MRLKKDSTEQKLRGAYYTPLQLSDAMVSLFVSENIGEILEPSCGDGVFVDSLVQKHMINSHNSITAIEIERDEAKKVAQMYAKNKNVKVMNTDFFDFYEENHKTKRYNLILGNPPYIRYQYLTDKQRAIQSKILVDHGMQSNKLINAWVCFLVACVQMLEDNGRIAFVVPAEILQVAYAEDLRLFLSNQLSKITLITFEKLVFPDIEQEVLVFIGEKGKEEKGIRIIEMNDLGDLAKLDLNKNGYQRLQHVKEKWTKYFISSEEIEIIQTIRADARFAKFSDLGIINVGITTGNNDYFSVNKDVATSYNLETITLPLIGRSSHAHGIYFTQEDWQKNVNAGKKAMLVSFNNEPINQHPSLHREYISKGEAEKQNLGYKCSIRDNWFVVPSVWVPDAFFLRRNNLYPKFVLNKCGAVSTDTMHRIKFSDGIDSETAILSYYNSISFAFTELCGRSYGGGVLEILPSEVGNIMLPIIRGLSENTKKYLLNEINAVVRNKEDIEKALDLVDKHLMVEFLGIEEVLCKECRAIWKKLQKRRLGRA